MPGPEPVRHAVPRNVLVAALAGAAAAPLVNLLIVYPALYPHARQSPVWVLLVTPAFLLVPGLPIAAVWLAERSLVTRPLAARVFNGTVVGALAGGALSGVLVNVAPSVFHNGVELATRLVCIETGVVAGVLWTFLRKPKAPPTD